MKQLCWNTLVVILLGIAGTSALAGPNAGGALWLHTDDALEFSDGTDYKGMSGRNCVDDFNNCPPQVLDCVQSANPTSGRALQETAVWWVLAAFDSSSCPRLSGITFGVGWENENDISIVASGKAGDFEIPTDGWPGYLLTGTAVTWQSPRLTHLAEVYWFAGYAYYGPAVFEIRHHPTQGSDFADDTIPANLDPIPPEKRGTLGLGGATGVNPDPDGPTPTLEQSWGSLKRIFGTPGE